MSIYRCLERCEPMSPVKCQGTDHAMSPEHTVQPVDGRDVHGRIPVECASRALVLHRSMEDVMPVVLGYELRHGVRLPDLPYPLPPILFPGGQLPGDLPPLVNGMGTAAFDSRDSSINHCDKPRNLHIIMATISRKTIVPKYRIGRPSESSLGTPNHRMTDSQIPTDGENNTGEPHPPPSAKPYVFPNEDGPRPC